MLTHREISREGYNIKDKVKDLLGDRKWCWSENLVSLIPQLMEYPVPSLDQNKPDVLKWCKNNGELVEFSTQQVWKDLQSQVPKVDWHSLVWFKNRIPRHSFILWLTMLNRLSTQKRMVKWKLVQGTGVLSVKLCKILEVICFLNVIFLIKFGRK